MRPHITAVYRKVKSDVQNKWYHNTHTHTTDTVFVRESLFQLYRTIVLLLLYYRCRSLLTTSVCTGLSSCESAARGYTIKYSTHSQSVQQTRLRFTENVEKELFSCEKNTGTSRDVFFELVLSSTFLRCLNCDCRCISRSRSPYEIQSCVNSTASVPVYKQKLYMIFRTRCILLT